MSRIASSSFLSLVFSFKSATIFSFAAPSASLYFLAKDFISRVKTANSSFALATPLVALASIPKPHDAFQKTAGILVLAPAAYTFARPLGDKSYPYDESTDRHLKDSPDVNSTVKGALPTPVVAPATPVAPVKPSVTPPTDKPAVVNGL